jgi:uncharacterized membrane protein YqiK
MLGYRVPAPDEAMLISGGRRRGETPFRVVTGHGGFMMPFFRKVRFLKLSLCEAAVAETCVTHQGIALNVRAVIAFKVSNDSESIVNAGQRFLSDGPPSRQTSHLLVDLTARTIPPALPDL